MRAMKDSGVEWIGEIPQDWKVVRTKYVVSLYTGNSIKDEEKKFFEDDKDAIPYISTKDININFNTVDYSNGLYVKNNDCNFVRAHKNDTLMCIEGGSAGKKKALLNQTVCFVNKLCCFHAIDINSSYLCWILNSPHYEEEFRVNLSGLIGGVTKKVLLNFRIPLPSKDEQRYIADYLDFKCSKINSIIEKQQAIIEKLKEYKLSIITEAVTKGLNPDVEMKYSGVDWIGDIPKNWTTYRLKYLLQERNDAIRVGPFGSQLTSKDFVDDGFWVYTQRNVLDKDFTKTDTFITNTKFNAMKGFSVEAGDVLVTTRGTGTTGHIVKVPTEFSAGIIHPCLMKFKLNENVCLYDYLYYVFEFAKYLRTQIDVANNTSSIPVLYSNTLCNLYVVVPPKDIQYDLIKYLNDKSRELDGLVEKRKQVIDKLTEYKKSLIYEVVTGKKEV